MGDDAVVIVENFLDRDQTQYLALPGRFVFRDKGGIEQSMGRRLELGAYIYGNRDMEFVVLDIGIVIQIELLSSVVADNKCVLWQLLVETFRVRAIDVKVQTLDWNQERRERYCCYRGAHLCGVLES